MIPSRFVRKAVHPRPTTAASFHGLLAQSATDITLCLFPAAQAVSVEVRWEGGRWVQALDAGPDGLSSYAHTFSVGGK